jgi:UDP-N-acetylmuramoyl-tripeptide--D-alanyl-D-alanine ligase
VTGRKIAVIGEMRELGSQSSAAHAALADALHGPKFDKIYLIGEACESLYDALGEEAPCVHALHLDDVSDEILSEIQAGDHVFVKGSNAMKLSKLVAALKSKHTKYEDAPAVNAELSLDEEKNPEEALSNSDESFEEEDSFEPDNASDRKKAV